MSDEYKSEEEDFENCKNVGPCECKSIKDCWLYLPEKVENDKKERISNSEK